MAQSELPRAYSYIRFSRPEQLRGDSLRRQLKMSKDWCAANGYILDKSLSLQDCGVSAFRGQNAARGKLSAFLKAVEQGKVAGGSVLLVESLDRLSRQEILPALTQFLNIIDHKISIVTLNPEERYDPDKLDPYKLIIAITLMSRAWEESATKSKRLSAAWEEKRRRAAEDGTRLTAIRPAWLDADFVAIPEAAETINMIFRFRMKGVGVRTIVGKLNADAPWTPPKNPKRKTDGWRPSYVKKILSDRAVIGECQPHKMVDGKRVPDGEPLPGYFREVVKPDLFFAV